MVPLACYSHQSSLFHDNSLCFSSCFNSNHDFIPPSHLFHLGGGAKYPPPYEMLTGCFCWLPQAGKWRETCCPHGYMHPKEEIDTPMDMTLQWGATIITFPGPVELEYPTVIPAL